MADHAQARGPRYDFEFADAFYEISRLLLITGGDEHRAHAYFRAALAMDGYGCRVRQLAEANQLNTLPAIGKGIAAKAQELLATGRIGLLEELRRQVPSWLVRLGEAAGIGPRTLSALYREDIRDPAILFEPGSAEEVRKSSGIPERQFKLIRSALESPRKPLAQLAHADALAAELKEWLCPAFAWRVEPTGPLRRREEVVQQVELVVGTADEDSLERRLRDFRLADGQIKRDRSIWVLRTRIGIKVALTVVREPQYFVGVWWLTTGNSEHLSAVMSRASSVVVECFNRDHEQALAKLGAFETEQDIYSKLGLAWVPPEIRQGDCEVQLAAQGRLPRLLEAGDVKADLHVHTRWSDGIGSIEEMAEAARHLGYEYMAITDHSVSLRIANGLSFERLLRQVQEIERWNQKHGDFRVLTGIEVDILPDGSLDLPDQILSRLDWVIASVHSAMNMPESEMMKRLERALSNPNVDALGHPTGRLLGKPGQIFYQREPFAIDVEELLKMCARYGVGLEINCFPERMDLPAGIGRIAGRAGVVLHLGTDSHSPEHLRLMGLGVDAARRAWLSKESVRNCQGTEEFLAGKRRRSSRGGGKPVRRRNGAFTLRWDIAPRTFERFFGKNLELVDGGYGVVGIDLTAAESRPSGWALLQGKRAVTRRLRSNADLIAATLDAGAHVVSIDSPLSLPAGRCCARDDCSCRRFGITRAAERALMAMRVGVFPALLPSMQGLTLRGIDLAGAFRQRGLGVIESYPGVAQDMLGISRKGRGIDLLLDGIRAFGIEIEMDHEPVHDELDAVTSALVGYFWRTGQYLPLSGPGENELIVPRIPKFADGKHSLLLGLAGPPCAGKTTVGQYLAFKYGFRYTRYSLVLAEMMAAVNANPSKAELREFGWSIHQTMGPVALTERLLTRIGSGENWVIDGLRHLGDFETLKARLTDRFELVFIESSEAKRRRRVRQEPLRLEDGGLLEDAHPVEEEVPLLSFRASLRIENNASYKELYEHVDRLIGAR